MENRLDLASALAAGHAADRLRAALLQIGDRKLIGLAVGGMRIDTPAVAVHALLNVLDDLAEGQAVTTAPTDLHVGTAEAARMLGVSRMWLTTLIDRGDLPGFKVGSKRRVFLGALIAQRRAQAERQREAATALGEADLMPPRA